MVNLRVWWLSSNARRNYTCYVCNSLVIVSQLVESYQGIYNFSIEVYSNITSVERLRDVMEGDKLNEGTSELGESILKIKFSDATFKY
ncbi:MULTISPECIES: hypothetical protein [Bacillus]|uniref:hypothetical protein n=1 Tax=Bacillus TaxID=1386 RepID=UPI000BEFEDCA|nr:hypothetical protein [Bacillus wiedmannii]PEM24404.1 hypothetical protein CN617_24545 [Bacillus wiedmannii]PFM45738.1 hypothetical protein COJ45_18635 [Bacillus cereus]PGS20345.1 hypothetical protein COC59_24850 [Bacillus cereus]